jgi:hypothetical protein
MGAHVRPFRLRRDPRSGAYRADLDELATLVTGNTKLLCLCNPNNPTGARLRPEELDDIARIADKAGCWVLSDEVYRGAELDGNETATMHGRLERVVVTGGLSKAYGLPGLRVGWVVGPRELVDGLWSVHDYTTIAPGALSDHLARIALRSGTRKRLLARTRSLLRENLALLLEWGQSFDEPLDITPPEAGAIAVVHCAPGTSSLEIARRARDDEDVLVVPGEHFDLPGTLRIGIGSEASILQEGLARLGRVLSELS